MNHATLDNLDEIMDVFKQYGDTFPHIRKDKIETMIEFHNVIWEEKVLITYNRYKRKQAVAMMTEKDRVISAYEAQKGDCILHQIAARDQGNGSAKKVFEKFIWQGNKNSDVILSVRSSNKRARKFYEKYDFKIVSDISWGKTKQIDGKVYLLDQNPFINFIK